MAVGSMLRTRPFRDHHPDMSRNFHSPVVPRPPTSVASPVGMIHVFGYTPAEGEQGVPITVQINFTQLVDQSVFVRLVVGLKPVATRVRELTETSFGRWQLEGAAPPFDRQSSANNATKVLITVQALNQDNAILDSVTFGEFQYWESGMYADEQTYKLY
jgi:hypothetical protein